MTTLVVPPEFTTPAEAAPRMLSIAANLLPPEIVDARRDRRARRTVLAALAAFAVLLAGWYSIVSFQAAAAESSLSGAQDDVQRLRQQQNQFGELVRTQAESQAISAELAALLAEDVQWSRLISSLQQAAPSGVQITGVIAAVAEAGKGAPTGGAATGAQLPSTSLPNTSAEKPIGSITLNGAGGSAAVAAYIDALAMVPGVANPFLADATLQDSGMLFTVRLNITSSALGGRYAPATSNQKGGK